MDATSGSYPASTGPGKEGIPEEVDAADTADEMAAGSGPADLAGLAVVGDSEANPGAYTTLAKS